MVGYSAWNGEDGGSSPSCYTTIVCSSNGSGYQAFYLMMPVRIRYRLQDEYWMVQWLSISEFESEDVGSSPTPITECWLSLIW